MTRQKRPLRQQRNRNHPHNNNNVSTTTTASRPSTTTSTMRSTAFRRGMAMAFVFLFVFFRSQRVLNFLHDLPTAGENNTNNQTISSSSNNVYTNQHQLLRTRIQQQQQQVELPSSSLPDPLQGQTKPKLKVAIYMTTHLSDTHQRFLQQCWPAAVEKLSLLQQADLIVYTSDNNNDHLYYNLQQNHSAGRTVGFQNVMFHRYDVHAYQEGALLAMVDPFIAEQNWFDGYDWIIRLNPDVLIRNDTWLLQTFENPKIDGIFVHWWSPQGGLTMGRELIHSDFYAFRPHAANGTAFVETLQQMKRVGPIHAETHLKSGFSHIIQTQKKGAVVHLEPNRVAWLPNAKRRLWDARTEGIGCDVVHAHEIIHYCPNYFTATDEKNF